MNPIQLKGSKTENEFRGEFVGSHKFIFESKEGKKLKMSFFRKRQLDRTLPLHPGPWDCRKSAQS